MRAIKRLKARGFTLVELMIVVAIIGVLAALAIFGVRKYLAAAKSAEARNTIGGVNRAAVAAYERENMPSELLPGGSLSQQALHLLCETSIPVPSTVPAGKKYQPKTGTNEDFNNGTALTGWRCLRFGLSEPHYYQYQYTKGSAFGISGKMTAPSGMMWASEAKGDLNGDGNTGQFAGVGTVENGSPKVSTVIFEADPEE